MYFGFEYDEVNETEETVPLLPGHMNTGLVASVNYNRPKFFADEVMPIVENICSNLGLLVIDPQDHTLNGDGSPKKAISQELIESWTISNKQALMIYKEHGDLPPCISRDKAEYWWNYQFHHEELDNEFDEDIFVPNIFLMNNPKENKVTTAITWTESVPFVFPKCDHVIIVHLKEKGFLRKTFRSTVMGIIRSDVLIEKLGRGLQTVDSSIGAINVLFPDQTELAKEIFYGLTNGLSPVVSKIIASDYMIDEKV